VRGNQNHFHAMKEIFKSAALIATVRPGPFKDFYAGLIGQRNEARDGSPHTGTQDRGHLRNDAAQCPHPSPYIPASYESRVPL
jgi:hypothetical protein